MHHSAADFDEVKSYDQGDERHSKSAEQAIKQPFLLGDCLCSLLLDALRKLFLHNVNNSHQLLMLEPAHSHRVNRQSDEAHTGQ